MGLFIGSPIALASESEYNICGGKFSLREWIALVQFFVKHFPTWEDGAV